MNLRNLSKSLIVIALLLSEVHGHEKPSIDTTAATYEHLMKAPVASLLFQYYDMLGVDGKMSPSDAPLSWLLTEVAAIKSEGKVIEIYHLVTEDAVLARAIGTPNIERDKVEFKIFIKTEKLGQANLNLGWAKLVSQVMLYKNRLEVQRAELDLLSGRIGIDGYVKRSSNLYYGVAKDARTFYKDKWKPWCHEKGVLPPSDVPWFGSYNLENFESWEKFQMKLGNLDVWRARGEKILRSKR